MQLYIVLFLHQTTTYDATMRVDMCCISYYSYIKPQLSGFVEVFWAVVYRTIPTSNHNWYQRCASSMKLYIVLFLHQTTTGIGAVSPFRCCISYYSYIKPQLYTNIIFLFSVVYRTIPTSNHNWKGGGFLYSQLYIVLFLHQTTTHPETFPKEYCCISYYSYIKPQLRVVGIKWKSVVYRTIPTSNHNW